MSSKHCVKFIEHKPSLRLFFRRVAEYRLHQPVNHHAINGRESRRSLAKSKDSIAVRTDRPEGFSDPSVMNSNVCDWPAKRKGCRTAK